MRIPCSGQTVFLPRGSFIGALVVLFLFYGVLKKLFLPVLIGALIGIGFMSYVFLFRIGKKSQDEE